MFNKFTLAIALIALLGITFYIYTPGLNGGYLLDDRASLSKLKIIDEELTAENLWDYFASSNTGSLKRPISVFSFLIDASTWPADPKSFKRTNVIIHILNGFFLFLLIFLLFNQRTKHHKKSLVIAFLSTFLWLLNPLLVSTTLYVVQRMAMLPTTFILMGLLVYYLFRKAISSGTVVNKDWILLVIVALFTLLAALSKENGILFVFLVFLFEYMICLKWLQFTPLNKNTLFWVLKFPALLLLFIIISQVPGALEGYEIRSFSPMERFLSQLRAVSSYIYNLYFPDYFTAGVYTDGFVVSKSLFNPLSTFFSAIFILALLIICWICRKKYIWISFAVFFFFITQSLESTIFPLEIYYEHRAYLSSVFMFVPIAILSYSLISKSKLYLIGIIVLLMIWVMFTNLRVNLWSNNLFLIQETVKKFPESIRARTFYAMMYDQSGLKNDALNIIESGFEHHDDLELKLNALLIRCDMNSLNQNHFDHLVTELSKIKFTKDDLNPMAAFMHKVMMSKCSLEISNEKIETLLHAFEKNTVTQTKIGKSWVDMYWADYYLIRLKNYQKALDKIKSTYDNNEDLFFLVDGAQRLINEKAYKQADELLKIAEIEFAKKNKFKIDWNNYSQQINLLKNQIHN